MISGWLKWHTNELFTGTRSVYAILENKRLLVYGSEQTTKIDLSINFDVYLCALNLMNDRASERSLMFGIQSLALNSNG